MPKAMFSLVGSNGFENTLLQLNFILSPCNHLKVPIGFSTTATACVSPVQGVFNDECPATVLADLQGILNIDS